MSHPCQDLIIMWLFAREHETWLVWIGIVSAAMFVGSLLAVPWLLARLPANYFLREHPHRREDPRGWLLWLLRHLAKNVVGALLLALGVAMLVLPGQGVLTILLGISLLDFPGKRACELWLIRRPGVERAINWLRRRAGAPPLQTDGDGAESCAEVRSGPAEEPEAHGASPASGSPQPVSPTQVGGSPTGGRQKRS